MPRLAKLPLETGAAAAREDRMWRYNGGPPCSSPSFSKTSVFLSKLFQRFLWPFCGISRGCKPQKPKGCLSKFFVAPASFQPYSRRHRAAFRRLALNADGHSRAVRVVAG
jgi:hypothetical protein